MTATDDRDRSEEETGSGELPPLSSGKTSTSDEGNQGGEARQMQQQTTGALAQAHLLSALRCPFVLIGFVLVVGREWF